MVIQKRKPTDLFGRNCIKRSVRSILFLQIFGERVLNLLSQILVNLLSLSNLLAKNCHFFDHHLFHLHVNQIFIYYFKSID